MAGGTGEPGSGMLERAARVLGSFSELEPTLTVGGIVERSGLPRSTVHRIASELVAIGYLQRGRGGYEIGRGLFEVGELSPLSLRLREASLPGLHRLSTLLAGENAHLAVLSDDDPATAEALYVARVTGPSAIPTLSRIGGRHPLHATGVGKALLSAQDDAWIEAFLRRPFERESVHTIVDPAALREDIAAARERGYASTRQEMTLGNRSVAVPLRPVAGLPPAAVGVVVHLGGGDDRRLVSVVQAAASEIADAVDATA